MYVYCLFKKSWPIFYSNLLHKMESRLFGLTVVIILMQIVSKQDLYNIIDLRPTYRWSYLKQKNRMEKQLLFFSIYVNSWVRIMENIMVVGGWDGDWKKTEQGGREKGEMCICGTYQNAHYITLYQFQLYRLWNSFRTDLYVAGKIVHT